MAREWSSGRPIAGSNPLFPRASRWHTDEVFCRKDANPVIRIGHAANRLVEIRKEPAGDEVRVHVQIRRTRVLEPCDNGRSLSYVHRLGIEPD
jgi:hypothetical protein